MYNDNSERVEFPEGTMIDQRLVDEESPHGETTVATDEGPAPIRGAAVDTDDEPAPEKTQLIQSPFDPGGPLAAPEPEKPSARLMVSFGNDRGREFPLPMSKVVVGRSLECEIVINDASVSRKHFEVDFRDGRWILKDRGSGNGTRVNGSKVSEIALEEGMQIEIGQTLLVFSSDAEKTRAVDSLDRPDEAKTVMADAVAQPLDIPVRKVTVERPPRIEVPVESPVPQPHAKEGGFPIVPVVIIAVVLVGLIGVGVAQFAFGVRILPIGGEVSDKTPAAASDEDPAVKAKAEAAVLYSRGIKAFQAKNWDQALPLLQQARDKDPSIQGLDATLSRAQDEKRNANLLSAARAALAKNRPEEAQEVLAKIQDTSLYFQEARQLLNELGDSTIGKEIERIRSLVKEKKKAEAKTSYIALLEAHPEDPAVAALRDELTKAGIELEPPKKVDVAVKTLDPKETSRITPTPSPTPKGTEKPGKAGKLDINRALGFYNSGAFSQAAAELRAMAEKTKGDDAKRALDLAGKIERFAGAYGDGKAALAGKRLDKAEQGLSLALRLDHEVNGHYDGELRSLLGDTYRGRAAAAIQNADYVQAAKAAKRAISYKGDDAMARTILDKCVARAQEYFDGAKADLAAGRKEAARGKLSSVLDIVPGNHPLAEKATDLMQQTR